MGLQLQTHEPIADIHPGLAAEKRPPAYASVYSYDPAFLPMVGIQRAERWHRRGYH